MNKTVLCAAAAAFAIGAGSVSYAATPTASSAGTRAVFHVIPPNLSGKSTVLYTQNTGTAGVGIVSQAFEAQYATYTSQGADDFTVPKKKTWKVTEVDVTGSYFNGAGPATSENVFFYKDAKGTPGKLVKMLSGVVGTDTTGSFAIKLPTAVKLKAGTYWVSVQTNQTFSTAGEWGWATTSVAQQGHAAMWQNPGGGFGTPCAKYMTETTCIASGEGPDHMFALLGTAK